MITRIPCIREPERTYGDEMNNNASSGANRVSERVVWRRELQLRLKDGGVTSRTMSRYMQIGKVPPYDVFISRQCAGWRLSTLVAAGFGAVCGVAEPPIRRDDLRPTEDMSCG